jgi:hypothetical protein
MTLGVQIATEGVARGAQFGLTFNPAVIQVLSVDSGTGTAATFFSDWASAHGAQVIVLPAWDVDSNAGSTTVGGIAIIGAPLTAGGPTGQGTIATVTVKAVANGAATSVVGERVCVARLANTA